MPSLVKYLGTAAALGAATSPALPRTITPPVNSTTLLPRNEPGQKYFDLGIPEPLCVAQTDRSICTTTIVGQSTLSAAWVWLFDYNCEVFNFDSLADWNKLGDGSFVMYPMPLVLPVKLHAGKDEFMKNYLDEDFWIEYKDGRQYWTGQKEFWDKGLSGGGAVNGFEIKRMAWRCDY